MAYCKMDGRSRPIPIEKKQHSVKEECFVKQEAKNSASSIGEPPKSRKRPISDISAGFTKAVIICNSSELTKSESNTYRPNNIVIELVKKNPMRYGKVTFQKFTSEREIREELSLRFPILKNRKFLFASADQYGKLNFRKLEEWSGRNLRRWLPGSSAMYIILDTSQVDDESEARTSPEHSATNVTNSSPYSGITCTTVVRVGASTTGPVSWRANNSQRALLDFLSSPEKSKLCDTKKPKMFAVDANEQKLDPAHSQSSKSPARLDLRSMALYTKIAERLDTDLASGVSRKQDYFSSNDSLLDESTISPKRKRMFNIPGKTFLRDTSVDLEQQALKIKKEPLDFDKISHETVDKPCSNGICKNTQQKNAKSSSQELITSNDYERRARTISNDCVECINEKSTADSTPSSPREGPHRHHLEGSRIPPYLSPYFMVNPRALYGSNPPLGEQMEKENENKVLNGNESSSTSHSNFSTPTMQAIYVPSTGFFPWRQSQSDLMRLPDKGPSLAFVPFEFLPYATNGRLFQYGNNSANTHMNQSLRELANLNVVHQNTSKNSALEGKWDERPKEQSSFACTEVSIETHPVEPDFTTKIKYKDVVQKFLDKTGTEERKGVEDQNLSYNCEIFPCSGPCKGGESFVVVLSQPLEDQVNQASFCATFDDTSVIELTRVDHFTLRGKSIPESHKSGYVTVRIEANDHLIGHSSYTYEESFIHGVKNAILSGGKQGERLLQFMTSSEKERNKMQEELTEWLELVLYLSAQKGDTHVIDTILGSIYGDAVKTQCSRRKIQPHQVARRNNHVELSQYLQNKLNRNDLENKKSIKIEKIDEDVEAAANKDFEQETPLFLSEEESSCHAQDCYDESRDIDQEEKSCQLDTSSAVDYERKADNLLLLSSIASRMETTASTTSVSSTLEEISNGTIKSRGKNTLKKETDSDRNHNRPEPLCSHGGFLKKVFVLPPNSLYLPSQSHLCKLRGSRSSYCKVYFTAEMSEDDVYDQIRNAFDDLVESSFRLAVVDQTGKLVFYGGFWTGKEIRRKLRGNSVLYVVPINENEDQEDE